MAQDNTSNPEVNLPKPQTNLPKPELDLPLPEKEIPAHLASQGQASGGYRTTGFLKNKVFWGFVIISGLIAFVAGGFYLGNSQSNKQSAQTTPTPSQKPVDSTKNWKTYKNTDLGFSFKYPSNWEESNKILKTKKIPPTTSDFIFSPEAINDFNNNPKNLGMPSGYWIEYNTSTNPKLCGSDISIIDKVTTFTLSNGQKGDYCIYNNKSEKQGAVFEIPFKNETLVFTLTEYYAEDKTKIFDYLKIFNNVLSTIQFTSSNSISNPSDWNKYSWTENNITLFSISYPKNWQSYERISENKKYQTLLFPKGYKYYEVDGKTSHITLAVSDTNPESCRGDCPVIESSSTEIINGLNARKLEGYNGEIGGNIPARYEAIIIENNKKFYIFTLYNKNLEKISAADKELFNQLLNSLEFTK